jgi:hypothetical protein
MLINPLITSNLIVRSLAIMPVAVVDIYPAEYKIPGEHVQFDCRPCPASPSPNAVSGPHWRSSGSPTYQYLTNLRRKVHAAKQVLETRFRTQAIELGFGLQ